VATVLLVAVVSLVAATVSAQTLGLTDELREPGPTVGVEAEFEARDSLEPVWVFTLTHVAGDVVEPGELTVRLSGDYGGTAENTYTRSFAAGDDLRVGLWGSPSRASNVDCEVAPGSGPPGAGDNQLDGYNTAGAADSEVRITVVHNSSGRVMDRLTVDLSEQPRRFGGAQRHYVVDGSRPSFNCEDYDWDA
jgi:hypothetical protein